MIASASNFSMHLLRCSLQCGNQRVCCTAVVAKGPKDSGCGVARAPWRGRVPADFVPLGVSWRVQEFLTGKTLVKTCKQRVNLLKEAWLVRKVVFNTCGSQMIFLFFRIRTGIARHRWIYLDMLCKVVASYCKMSWCCWGVSA